jgi:pyruvyl transferase EpsI
MGRDKSSPVFVLLGTHDYGNIGDLAINYCEKVFLGSFDTYPLYVFSRRTLLANWQLIQKSVSKDDIIFIHGGGNMGDIWLNEERARRKIVEDFPDNKIISLPQSIKFYSKEELLTSKRVYGSHKSLLMFVRDDASFDFAQKQFEGVDIYRTEDIVFNYVYTAPERESSGAVLFFERNDREKGSDDLSLIRDKVNELGYDNYTSDTVVEGMVAPTDGIGAELVYDKIDEAHAARVVVTNRLHGAVFALLAGRPVIVVDNSYGKVSGALKNVASIVRGRLIFSDDGASNITSELLKELCEAKDSHGLLDKLRTDTSRAARECIDNFIRR